MPSLNTRVGAVMRRIRNYKGITLEQLAHGTGYSACQISRLESGACSWRLNSLQVVCKSLGTLPSSVVDEAEKE